MQFRVGVMFLATFIIVGILLVMFGKLPDYVGYNSVQIQFDNAGGIAKGTPIRKSGILIGRVKDVQLTQDDSKVLVTADIQKDKTIYQNEVCTISRDLLGDTALVFATPKESAFPRHPIDPDVIIKGEINNDPTGLIRALDAPIKRVENTGDALTAASGQLEKAAKRVEDILDKKTEQNVKSVLDDAAASLSAIRKILGDQDNQQKLTEAMQKLPKTLDNMNNTFEATNDTLRKFTTPAADGKTPVERMVSTIDMAERTMRKFSEPAREGEMAPVDQIAKSMENINEITSVVRSVLERMEDGEGTLGAMMKDRQLYDRLNRTAKNLEDITYKLKPIIDDARVFSDKIARHPGSIVRDAVKPGVGIK